MAGENRASNIVQYTSPSIADMVNLNVAIIPGEQQGGEDDGVADAISTSLVFDNGAFYGALAYDSEISDSLEVDVTSDNKLNIFRATAMARLDMFEVGAMYQLAEEDNGNGEDATFLVSGAVKFDRVKFKAQYGLTNGDQNDEELTLIGIGADYKLAKASKVYSYLSQVEADKGVQEDTTFGVGFEHKFSM